MDTTQKNKLITRNKIKESLQNYKAGGKNEAPTTPKAQTQPLSSPVAGTSREGTSNILKEGNVFPGDKILRVNLRRVNSTSSVSSANTVRSESEEANAGKCSDNETGLRYTRAKSISPKRAKARKRKGSETDTDTANQTERETNELENIIPKIPEKRKPGRPETTGEYRIKCAREKQMAEEAERRREQEIIDPTVKPKDSKSYREFLENIQNREEEYRETPVPDLEVLVAEGADYI